MTDRHYPRAMLLLAILAACTSRANEANYQHYILGDRATGMGGAATAIARSCDALAWDTDEQGGFVISVADTTESHLYIAFNTAYYF